MLHHVSFGVTDMARSSRFYDAVLAEIGYVRVWEDLAEGREHLAIGYGAKEGDDKFAIKLRRGVTVAPGPGFHLAFAAPDLASVHRFHAAALANGGRDNGAPGPRPDYGPTYHACFVLDPDGYPLEAVIDDSNEC